MNREVHVRVWERAEVKFLRATRHSTKSLRDSSLRRTATIVSAVTGVEIVDSGRGVLS